MTESARMLVVDDEASVRESLRDWLKDAGYDVSIAANGNEALEVVKDRKPQVVITDLVMPGLDGLELTKKIREISPETAVIVVTAYASIATAIAAIKEGAYDYVEKPFCPERVEALIKNVIEHQKLAKENVALRERLEDRYRFEGIIAKSPSMQQIFDVVKVVAKSSATVLVTGESGTGKELIARALHNLSLRKDRPFVAVSCSALPESLLESELFGHERGAFTGAVAQKKGKFEYASRGTLFLDEIGEISPNIQVHLLRVIEEKEFTRVGSNEPVRVDVRIISATNKDLKKAVVEGKFREDLYYRLNVVTIDLPPLRQRKEDVPLLADHFLKKFCLENQKDITGFSPEAREFIFRHDWPGNVRELENAIERAVIICGDNQVCMSDLVSQNFSPVSANVPDQCLAEVEKNHIMSIINEKHGNFSEAARVLGITRMTLYNKVKAYGLIVKRNGKDQPAASNV